MTVNDIKKALIGRKYDEKVVIAIGKDRVDIDAIHLEMDEHSEWRLNIVPKMDRQDASTVKRLKPSEINETGWYFINYTKGSPFSAILHVFKFDDDIHFTVHRSFPSPSSYELKSLDEIEGICIGPLQCPVI